MNLLGKVLAFYRGEKYNNKDQCKVIAMSRPGSDTPKEHTSIIRAKRKDGWTYVQRVVSVYDPRIKEAL